MRIGFFFEIHYTDGTFYPSGVGAGQKQYRYGDVEDSLPGYMARLLEPASLTKGLSDPFFQLPGARQVTFRVSNILQLLTATAPTISSLAALPDILIGVSVRGRAIDLDTGTTLMTVVGVIADVSSITEQEATITVTVNDIATVTSPLPAQVTSDWFPSADLSTVSSGLNHCPQIPFGLMPKAELARVHAHYLSLSFGMVSNGGNNFLYDDFSPQTPYVIQTGDVLYYDVMWATSGARIGFDLVASDATALRDQVAPDQNGYQSHPTTNIPDATILNRWYRRRIPLIPMVGKNITHWLLACENDTTGTFAGSFANAIILGADGAVRVVIFDQLSPTLTFPHFTNGNPGFNSSAHTRQAVFDYGPIRKEASGVISTLTVYRDVGGVVPAAEYSLIEFPPGFRHVRFTVDQRDSSGNPAHIWADLNSTEFSSNPANALKLLINDAKFGFNLPVVAASFTTAASDYATAGVTIGDGIRQQSQRPLEEFFVPLLLRGAVLDRDDTAGYTLTVDTAARHVAASIGLGEGDDRGWNNFVVTAQVIPTAATMVKTLTLRGRPDPGFGTGLNWLISTIRDGNPKGTDRNFDLPFVIDVAVLDQEAYYQITRLVMWSKRIQGTASLEAAVLAPWNLLNVYLPNMSYSGVQMEVREVTIGPAGSGIGVTLDLNPWDTALFTYVPGTKLKVDPRALYLTDYSHTPPTVPLNLQAPTFFNAVAGDGKVHSWVRLQADAPLTNVNTLVFQAIRRDSLGQPTGIVFQETDIPTSEGRPAIKAEMPLANGLQYDFQVFARNTANATGYQDGTVAAYSGNPYTIPKDTIAPAAPGGLAVASQPGVGNLLTWTPNTDLDLFYYELHRNTVASGWGAGTVLVKQIFASTYSDTGVAFNTTLYYRLRAYDFSGNVSAFSITLVALPVPAGKIAGSINSGDLLVHFDLGFMSTRGIKPLSGLVASLRPDGKFGRAAAVDQATTNKVGTNPGFETGDLTGWSTTGTAGAGDAATVQRDTKFDGLWALKLVCASGNAFGKQQTISELIGDGTTSYTLSAFINVTGYLAGKLNLNVIGAGIDTSGIVLTALTNGFLYYTETFVPPMGTTSVTVRFFGNGSPSFTAYLDNVQIEQGSFATSFVKGARGAGVLEYPSSEVPVSAGTILKQVYVRSGAPHSAFDGFAVALDIAEAGTLNNRISIYKENLSTNWTGVIKNAVTTWAPNIATAPSPGWHLVGVTWDKAAVQGVSGPRARFYWDGMKVADNFGAPLALTFANAQFGALHVGTARDRTLPFNSRIDELVILHHEATPEEMKKWFDQDAPFYDPSPIHEGFEPGPPTNLPTNLALINSPLNTGGRLHDPTWSYIQPAAGSRDKPTEGFRIRFAHANTPTPNEGHIDLGPDAREHKFFWGANATGVVSYSITAYCLTVDGTEETAVVTSGVWQNVPASNTVTTVGHGDGSVTTPKRVAVSSQAHLFSLLSAPHSHTENLAASYTQNATTAGATTSGSSQSSFSFSHGLSQTPIVTLQTDDDVCIPYVSILGVTTITMTVVTFITTGTRTPTVTAFYW